MAIDCLSHMRLICAATEENPVFHKIMEVLTNPSYDTNHETKEKMLSEFKPREIQDFIGKLMVPTLKFNGRS